MRNSLKLKNRFPLLISLLITIPLLISNFYFYQKSQRLEKPFTVREVIDGDTFVLDSGQRVRLRAIYAPELDLCGGPQAKEELEDLILGKTVRLEEIIYDSYGRSLALVYLNETLVNEIMLRQGWARFDGNKNSKSEALKDAYQIGREEKKGIFSSLCHQEENLENLQCSIKGNIDKETDVKTYHFLGCREYSATIVELDLGDQWFCTEKEAQDAGFKKSENCFGKTFKP